MRVQPLTKSDSARARAQGHSSLHARTASEVRALECVLFAVGSLFKGRSHFLVRHAGGVGVRGVVRP